MKKRLLSMLLTLAMLASMVPTTAFAEETVTVSEQTKETDSGLVLDKKVNLEADGTYTITLEAYAKGETQTVYTPMDILFVLDQSGSMLQVDDASQNVYVDYDGNGTVQAEIKQIDVWNPENNLVDLNGDGKLDNDDKKISVSGLSGSTPGKIQYYTRDQQGSYHVLNDDKFEENAQIGGYYINATSHMISVWRTFFPAVLKKAGNSSADQQWKNAVIEKKDGNNFFTIKDAAGNIKYEDLNEDFVLGKTRYGVVTDVTTSFINKVHDLAVDKHTDHRMGLVGFSGDTFNGYDGTALYVTSVNAGGESTWKEYRYDHEDIQNQYRNAFHSMKTDNAFLDTMRSYRALAQQTRQDIGLEMANSVFAANDYTSGANKDRKKIAIFITDGAPSPGYISEDELKRFDAYDDLTTFDGGSTYVANRSIIQANELKKNGVEVYSIGLLRGGYSSNTTLEYMLDRVSSNYSYSSNLTDKNNFGYMLDQPTNGYTASQADKAGYCNIVTADDSLEDELQKIFDSITKDVTSSTVELRSEAVLKDIVAKDFALPNDAVKNVKVETSQYLGSGQWDAPAEYDQAAVTVQDATVAVTGFDYADNYVSEAVGTQSARGAKLIVTITNILARGSAATGSPVYTNGAASGIYPSMESTSPAALFERPTETIMKKAYVLDFAKPVEVKASDWKMGKVIDLDDASLDDLMSTGTSKIKGTVFQKYGTTERIEPMEAESGDGFTGFTGLRYTPQATNWDGYDRAFVFGYLLNEDGTVDNDCYMWSRVDFIPATSVYYEDSFVTSTIDGVEGITYSDGWTVEGTVLDPEEDPEELQSNANIVYGYDELYADNAGLSDGSAHTAKSGATAKFTFTGTGVDIYTRTDVNSAQVLVQAVGKTSGKVYTAWVDNKFESVEGGLYQIPTVAFSDMVRDTYDVTITVLQSKTAGADGTYYLDAIRVYNPLDENADSNVKEAYKEAVEDDAVTATVRSYLLDGSNWVTDEENGDQVINGAVYIDKLQDSTSNVGTYKDYGPKNEVYLEAEEKIAFAIETDYQGKAYIGLKAAGTETATVTINGTQIEINSSTDLYYEIPENAENSKWVVIQNDGPGLMSVTKLRLTQVENPNEKISLIYTQEFCNYVRELYGIKDNSSIENPFTDVKKGAYYYDPVIWAWKNGITSGYSATEFGTGETCTRAEAITFLWRVMGCPEPKDCQSAPFSDVTANRYYYKAVQWAKEEGIVSGRGGNKFDPNETITRGEFLTFLYRARRQPACSGVNPFKDVSANKFYYNPILWAVENGITSGVSKDMFAPEMECTREQVVTFLYRDRG